LIKRSIPLKSNTRRQVKSDDRRPTGKSKEIMMTKKLYSTFAMMGLFLMLAFVSVSAQSRGKIEINVPFDFSLDNQTLSAGAYSIRQLSQTSMLVESADGQTRVIAQATGRVQLDANEKAPQEKLVFHKYGNQYFLAQVWMVRGSDGRELSQSSAERQAAREQKLATGGAKLKKVEVAVRAR
jgi:hypothetical protein